MNAYEITKEENEALQVLRNVLYADKALVRRMLNAGLRLQQLEDPEDAYYMGDLLTQAEEEGYPLPVIARQLLEERIDHKERSLSRIMVLRSEDTFEKITQEDLLRLLWRNRGINGHVVFMRDEYYRDDPPKCYTAETWQGMQGRVLRCYDQERENAILMSLDCRLMPFDYAVFSHEMRAFLEFEPTEDVWISAATNYALEVGDEVKEE